MSMIFENKKLYKWKFSKNVYNKKHAPKLTFFNEKKLERFGYFLTQKIDFESQISAFFDRLIQNIR